MADPRIIKRYPNRKLYDPGERSFTTLRGVEEMVRAGVDVKVVDNATGADVTQETLAKILPSTSAGGTQADADLLAAMIRAPRKLARALAGRENDLEELRRAREEVRLLSRSLDALLAKARGRP